METVRAHVFQSDYIVPFCRESARLGRWNTILEL